MSRRKLTSKEIKERRKEADKFLEKLGKSDVITICEEDQDLFDSRTSLAHSKGFRVKGFGLRLNKMCALMQKEE